MQSETQTYRAAANQPHAGAFPSHDAHSELCVRVDSREIWNDRRLADSLEATYQLSFDRPSLPIASGG